jgi:hypothetical protein
MFKNFLQNTKKKNPNHENNKLNSRNNIKIHEIHFNILKFFSAEEKKI